jgi:hemolysin activation/secretion protein
MRRSRLSAGNGSRIARWAPVLGCCAAFMAAGIVRAQDKAAAAPPPTPVQSFDVEAYDVDGATILPQLEIEKAVYPFLGPGRTRDDVEHARAALEKAYHDKGYQSVVVEVPAQTVADAVIRLHVVEAPVGRLRVIGSRYFSPDFIRTQTPALAEGQVPDFNQAQKQLADVNRLADRRVTPLLRAGQAPGTVDVDLKVNDTLPLHASVELNNDHSQNTDPLRLIATAHYDNLWQLGHSASFTYAVAPTNRSQSEVFAGTYLAPLWTSPVSLLLYGYTSNSNVAAVGGVTVLGKGYTVGARGVVQLPSLGAFAESFSAGMDLKDLVGTTLFASGPIASGPIFDTATYFPLSATYTLQQEGGKSSAKVSLAVTAGLRGLGSDLATVQNKRANAQTNFVHLNLDVTLTHRLAYGFEGALHASGQIADSALLPSEQFAAGGLSSVRGYLQAEAIGDQGVSGGLELRSPSLAPFLGRYVDDLRFYGFFDAAALQVLSPLPQQTDFFDLYSGGVGMRFQILKHLSGEAVVAVPLTDGVATRADRPRATFSVKSEF